MADFRRRRTERPAAPDKSLAQSPLPADLDLGKSRPPAGRRMHRLDAADFGEELPDDAAGWMKRAQRMANALQAAIEAEAVTESVEACIERAWAAWELNGTSDRQIAKVAHLTTRAHAAMRESTRAELEETTNDCALVLHSGLPPTLQRRIPFELVLEVVRQLRRESDPWPAVVHATQRLLGWDTAGQAHAAQAVRIALEQRYRR